MEGAWENLRKKKEAEWKGDSAAFGEPPAKAE
jgi:hypothetical protein